jgi:lipid II isoglutaminyl synthase (glutamine-hydrolysing)
VPDQAIEVVPQLDRALDRGLELTEPGGELVVLPTYTAMLGLRGIVAERGYAQPYWERAA